MSATETPEVRLTPLSRDDLETMREWVNDPELMALIDRVGPVHETGHEDWFRRLCQDDKSLIWAIRTVPEDEYIGNAGLSKIDHRAGRALIWVYLGNEQARGRGLGRRAARLVLYQAFSQLRLNRVACYVAEDNPASVRMFQAAGLTVEGTARDYIYQEGTFKDAVWLSILKREWNGV
jgi:RimJ/RimL family protein N-acetyltransferase